MGVLRKNTRRRILILTLEFVLAVFCVVNAQGAEQQLQELTGEYNAYIDSLEFQLRTATTLCIIMSAITFATVFFYLFEYQILSRYYQFQRWYIKKFGKK